MLAQRTNDLLKLSLVFFGIVMFGLLFIRPAKVAAFDGQGSGTSLDPYLITNCVQLGMIADDYDAHYALANDVSCADSINWGEAFNGGYKGFDPIGDIDNPFTGTLDGNSHTISDLYINRAEDTTGQDEGDENYVGLFARLSGATISNLSLANIMSKGYENVGGIAGYAENSTIQNVNVNVDVVDNSCNPGHCIWARWGLNGGGIVGVADNTVIEDVNVGGPVKGSGVVIGGIAGYVTNNSTITNATTTSSIDGGGRIGGIVGFLEASFMSDVSASGNVDCVYDDGIKQGNDAGGLVGYVDSSEILRGHASGLVTGWSSIGGLVGGVTGTSVINDSFATGEVIADNYAGGFVGYINGGEIAESYATGDVSTVNYNVGGFVGYMSGGVIEDSYSRGNVLSETSYAGGFVGTIYGGAIRRSFATGIVTIPESGSERAGAFSSEAYEDGGNDIVIQDSFATGAVNAPAGEGGFIANLNTTGMIFSGNYFDITRTAQANCRAVEVEVEGCTGVNADNSQPNYFINNSTNPPFTNWNFSDIWQTVSGGYPCLLWQTECDADIESLPTYLCEEASVTMSSFTASCTTDPVLQVTNSWELQYKKTSDSAWISLDSQPGVLFDVTVTGLDQATRYELRFRFVNDLGTSEWGLVEVTTESDLNGDNINDSEQPNIGGYRSMISGKYVAIDVGEGCELTTDDMAEEQNLPIQDAAYDYDNGLWDFEADCTVPVTTIKLYYYGVSKADLIVRKFNPNTNAYFNLTGTYGATLEEITIDGELVTVASYQIEDNGDLDTNFEEGSIADPVGLAKAVVGVPNTGIKPQKSL